MGRDHQLDGWILAIGAQQDRAAFASLFQQMAPRVKGYLMRGGAGPTQAEEITQEVMLTVWRKAAAFDPARASAATWIFTIARNRRIDSLRRGRPEVELDDAALEPAPARQLALLAEVRDAERVQAALAELPPQQAEVLRLAYFEHKTLQEVSESLGVPLGTIKSRVRLAFKRLRVTIQDMEPS